MKDIKLANTFEDVQEIRKRQVEVEKVGGDHEGIQRILSEDMYDNRLRFIDELLQNAQDAARKAKKEISVEFRLYNDKLVFCHSGKEFDLQDIINITGIGVSTKRDEDIGIFGIGFKSVYCITNEPHIYSGEYQFKISEFRIPYRVPENNNIQETEIVLPFKTETEIEQEKIYSYFNEIELESLIFLPNIEAITWSGHREDHRKNCLDKKILDKLEDDDFVYKKIAITNTLLNRSKHYLVFQRIIQIGDKELNIEIAFGFDKDKNEIIPLKNNTLHVYFPTKEETHLNFLLNAPFRTTANRANIKLEKEDDDTILKGLSQLVADSVLFIKKHYPHLLDLHFYSKIIPLNGEDENKFYKAIFEKIKELLINPERKLLPTQNSDFASANNLLLAENRSLIELLNNTDIKQLFGKEYWITIQITSTKEDTKDLYIYLKEQLGIKEIGFENFAKKFTEEFISTKDDQWIKMFYKVLLNNSKRLWEKNPWEIKHSWQNQTDGIWKTKPIIRLDNEKHISPYDEQGKLQAWLPSKTTSYFNTVKSTLIEDEDAKSFLTDLRLKKPDLLAEFSVYIAPKYKDENSNVEKEVYLKDLYKAIETYEEVKKNSDKRDEFIKTIKSLHFIKAENISTGNKLLKKPEEVYFPTEELKIWFQGNKEVYFVENIYQDFNDERKRLNEFFSAIGISKEIRFYPKPQYYNMKKYYCSPEHKHGVVEPKNFYPKFNIDGLNHAIDNINIERSKLIWINAIDKFSHLITAKIRSAKFKRCLTGEYDENKPEEIPDEKRINSIAGELLREKYWLYDKNEKLIQKPNSEISLEDLHNGYDQNHDNINKLVKSLGLQPDTFTKEQVDEFLQKKDEEIEELKRELNKYKKTESRKKPQRGYNLDKLTSKGIPEPEVLPENDGRDLIGLEEQDHTKDGFDIDKNKDGKELTDKDHGREESDIHPDTKEYGRWAEEYVVKELKEKYKGEEDIIIEWLNETVEKGVGCDIIIKKKNESIEFIEVKGKVSDKPEFFEATDKQFRFAQKQGEKFFFYIVSNVKSEQIKIDRLIKNPIKLWKENKLLAYPVRFKL